MVRSTGTSSGCERQFTVGKMVDMNRTILNQSDRRSASDLKVDEAFSLHRKSQNFSMCLTSKILSEHILACSQFQ